MNFEDTREVPFVFYGDKIPTIGFIFIKKEDSSCYEELMLEDEFKVKEKKKKRSRRKN